MCPFVQKILFCMGASQNLYQHWGSFKDIITYALTLPQIRNKLFSVVLSSIFWCVWKMWNEICISNKTMSTNRNMILTICSVISYWAGNLDELTNSNLYKWLPADLKVIPIKCLAPVEILNC